MRGRLHVATRKGLLGFERGPNGWRTRTTAFLGVPVTIVLEDERDGAIYAALNHGHFGVKLHRSDDDGTSWHEIATPSFPDDLAGSTEDERKQAPSVHQIWALARGGHDQPGTLWAGTIPGALFVSANRGDSWQLVRSLWDRPERQKWFGGGYDHPGIHSICVDPRDSRRIVLAVSCGGVWVTSDRGETWDCQARGMYAAYMPPEGREDPTIQDPHRMVQCRDTPDVFWVQHHNGVFRSIDGTLSWHDVPGVLPSTFGFAVAVHPEDPDTAWFVPGVKDECRVPVDGRLVVSRTRNGGRSFDVLREGLPQEHAFDLVYRHALDIDDTGYRLAMGSTTGNLWVTGDGGDHWECLSRHLPPIYQVLFA